jgi:ABC-2 type transport system permease protein
VTGPISAEIRKLRTVRTTWLLTAMGWALVALSSGVFLFREELTGPFRGTDAEIAVVVDQAGSAAIIVLLVAVLAVTTEFRHGTMGRTLQLTPSRARLLTAKMATMAGYALAFFVVSLVVAGGMLLLAGAVQDVSLTPGSETLLSLWQAPAGLALNAVFGVAIGALLRSQVMTITVTLVWLFVAENLVAGLLPEAGRWLPFQVLNAIFLSPEALAGIPAGQVLPVAPGLALLTFLGYVTVAAVTAGLLLRTRDV